MDKIGRILFGVLAVMHLYLAYILRSSPIASLVACSIALYLVFVIIKHRGGK